MAMITIYLFIYLFFIYFDLIPVIQNKYNKVFVFNLIVTIISFTIIILVGLNIKVPNPNDFIETIVRIFIGQGESK